jgi:nucleoside-diphosphate-sugar epimerase
MILVTGATGFLGAHILYQLVSRGERVKALFRHPEKQMCAMKIFRSHSQNIDKVWNNIQWVQGDILNYFQVTELLNDVTEVYHVAGLISLSDRNYKQLHQVNVLGTANMVNASLERGVKKFCYVSSIATLGESSDSELIDESATWNPGGGTSSYAISKMGGEMEVWRGVHEGLSAFIVNPSVIVGPGMWVGNSSQLMDAIYRGLTYYPPGSSGYVDVRDVAKAAIQLMESNHFGERFIITAENLSHYQVLCYLALAMNRALPSRKITPLGVRVFLAYEGFRKFFTGIPPRMTRRAFEMASSRLMYSGEKLFRTIGMKYLAIEESCRETANLYLQDRGSNG